ncbi:MAG TPA: polymer-forming cytoskeletal protein [Candidatus Acidoferrum sp.]|nr:polymer-forming cytoskeletal protein [Candidatus Acidoferrum sp.]
MWKKEDGKSPGGSEISTAPAAIPVQNSSNLPAVRDPHPSLSSASAQSASISQGIRIKGEVTGSEDLFVDGHVDGKLSLTNGCLTIGPNGSVKADVTAREVVVRGKVEGKVSGRDKVLLGNTGIVAGEILTDRLAIEDGAMLRGRVEAGKQPAKSPEAHATAAAGAGATGGKSVSLNSGTAAD